MSRFEEIDMVCNIARMPTFMIAGAPKCGTTALYEYLQTHPQILLSNPKEPHFYAEDLGDHREVFTQTEYDRLFAAAGPEHLAIGEASAWYLHSSVALPRVARELPEIKLIVMLRNPAELVRSLHSDLVWICFENENDFEAAWSLQDERKAGRRVPALCQVPWFLQYREVGRLSQHVRRLLSVFPREQVRFYLLDDMKESPARVYQDVLAFLGLPDDGRTEFPRVNASKRNRLQRLAWVQSLLVRSLPRPCIQAGKRIGLGKLNRTITELNCTDNRPATPGDEFRKRLSREFHDDVCELEILLERKLDHWKSEGTPNVSLPR
jgi:Sulfotransferase domain